MNKELELKGFWWLPETPGNTVPGELIYKPDDGISLYLHNDLFASIDDFSQTNVFFQNVPIILGMTLNGKQISLLYCTQFDPFVDQVIVTIVPTNTFNIRFAFIGVHFSSPSNAKFLSINIAFSHLDEWMAQRPYKIIRSNKKRKMQEINKLTIQYNKTKPISVMVDEYCVSFKNSGPNIHRPSIGELVLSQKSWAIIKANSNPKGIEELIQISKHIQNFLTLGVGEPVYPLEMVGFCEENKQVFNGEKIYYPPVQIVYRRPWKGIHPKRILSSQMIFTLETIRNQLMKYLNRWFKKDETLKPVINIYFALLYRSQTFLEFQLIGLAQAIETYHRQVFGGKYQSDDLFLNELYPKLVKAVPPDLDDGFKQALKEGKLRYANEYSLRKRLHELTNHVSEIVPLHFLIDNSARRSFVKRVVKTRNYLIHFNQELEHEVDTTAEGLLELVEKLKVLMNVLLLEEVGFTDDQITQMIKNNSTYSDFI
jgi:hypothetical protein